jgi:glycosyltransferase involved in cell wall biosynthesis
VEADFESTSQSTRRRSSRESVDAPWLTVIIPSYCGEQWIGACLGSLVCEAVGGIEVVIIDSSPSSATRDVAEAYSDRLRLRVLERCDLKSWQAKTNLGVHLAESSHICWLGVDDLWLPGRAAAARRWIEDAPDASLHLAPCAIIDKYGRNLGVWRCPLPTKSKLPSALVRERLLVQNFIAAPAPVFRRDAWLSCGGLDESLWYTADWDLWLKLVARGSVHYHDAVTVGFRVHNASLTVSGSRDPTAFAHQMQIVLNRHIGQLGGVPKEIERAARASITVNAALASASGGNMNGLLRAASEIMRLGPTGIRRYFRDSRIVERIVPRLRAKLTGAF